MEMWLRSKYHTLFALEIFLLICIGFDTDFSFPFHFREVEKLNFLRLNVSRLILQIKKLSVGQTLTANL